MAGAWGDAQRGRHVKRKQGYGGKNVKMREKERIRRRDVGRDCVGLKSWHLLNRAAALGAKCCQTAPQAWISALPLSLFQRGILHHLYSTLFLLLYISAQYHPNRSDWHLLPLNKRINTANEKPERDDNSCILDYCYFKDFIRLFFMWKDFVC